MEKKNIKVACEVTKKELTTEQIKEAMLGFLKKFNENITFVVDVKEGWNRQTVIVEGFDDTSILKFAEFVKSNSEVEQIPYIKIPKTDVSFDSFVVMNEGEELPTELYLYSFEHAVESVLQNYKDMKYNDEVIVTNSDGETKIGLFKGALLKESGNDIYVDFGNEVAIPKFDTREYSIKKYLYEEPMTIQEDNYEPDVDPDNISKFIGTHPLDEPKKEEPAYTRLLGLFNEKGENIFSGTIYEIHDWAKEHLLAFKPDSSLFGGYFADKDGNAFFVDMVDTALPKENIVTRKDNKGE